MAYQKLEMLINLHDGYRRAFRVQHKELLLIQDAEERYLIDRHCPHAGQRLDKASVNAGMIVCPRHGQCFLLSDGSPCLLGGTAPASEGVEVAERQDPEPIRAVGVYELVYDGNTIGVDV